MTTYSLQKEREHNALSSGTNRYWVGQELQTIRFVEDYEISPLASQKGSARKISFKLQ